MIPSPADPAGLPGPAPGTSQRLLEAAGEVFAEKGFRGATVRDICRQAGANVAAVNYHFRDKEELYAAVLQYAHRCAMERYPPDLGLAPGARHDPEARLGAFVRSFLLRLLAAGRPAWHGKLMAREIAEPTKALDALVEHSIRPNSELLRGILRELLGPGAAPRALWHGAWSVVGQCVFYYYARAVIVRLNPNQGFDDAQIKELADHITRFTLAATQGMRGSVPGRAGQALRAGRGRGRKLGREKR